ncbi:acetyltransferase, GNAT family [Indibacter alkaliphilus LW1]|uniref:Acetyltransferase, GNAT family n=1 Tax=Indibacter alkaliphilus (strain CCUG 57479 / KCTC 22604 / LW1) TaxID=1189612 RepID=S2D3E3_INDAL|nr:GNAT family N-acetyltransferase [Indibacter alkaliphilus]EOZ91540.1 acetyltransferase, GNAT family [Indibacter alkaliphilus LW1]
MKYTIQEIKNRDLPIVVRMIKENRQQLFPMLPPLTEEQVEKDFIRDFILSKKGAFLLAKDSEAKIIGMIGMKLYDHHFANLKYANETIVEIVKLFVKPEWRRNGLATVLYRTLEIKARALEIQLLYLHTHRFLPGAISFWEQNGFLKTWEQNGNLETVHFEKKLKNHPTVRTASSKMKV